MPLSMSIFKASSTHSWMLIWAIYSIDGVLLRSATPIPGASETLQWLLANRIPYILLTNGGGKSEAERCEDLSSKLDVPITPANFMQSHTPFADMSEYHGKTVLVVGGDYDKCQLVAQEYGFKSVVTPGDIVTVYPDIWPFSRCFSDHYARFAKPLPNPINPANREQSLKIDAVFVYNDPRDWGLDSTIMLDLLLSQAGYLGTLSPKNGDSALPNNGYLQDSQPHVYYSNPDLWWAASYPLNRLGQGGFQAAFAGLWHTVTSGAKLDHTLIGKPHHPTYEFAERLLRRHRKSLLEGRQIGLNDPLRRVYMVGDNPESDIRGANNYRSPHGSDWTSILVRTGVYRGGEPSCKPHIVVDDVQRAVEWAIEDAVKKRDG